MPRYFFHIQGGLNLPDHEGTVYADPQEARDVAVTAAAEVLKDQDGGFWNNSDWQMLVTDELGRTVCTLSIKGNVERE